jgi:Bacterial protein of unknown function (HtrL_YibB)
MQLGPKAHAGGLLLLTLLLCLQLDFSPLSFEDLYLTLPLNESLGAAFHPSALPLVSATSTPAFLTTVVTSYFALGTRSKHSEEDYLKWMERFLKISGPIIVYTTNATAETITKLRENRPIKIQVLRDVWELPYGNFKDDYTGYQFSIDPEHHIHYPELYVIWNSKVALVGHAARTNPFGSQYFMWVDMGSFRDARSSSLGQWPSDLMIKDIFMRREKMILAGAMKPLIRNYTMRNGPVFDDLIQGGFFCGTASSIYWLEREYWHWHGQYLAERRFAGKEQPILGALAASFPSRFLLLESYRSQGDFCGDPWFYFQPFLAGDLAAYCGCARLPLLLPSAILEGTKVHSVELELEEGTHAAACVATPIRAR